MWPQEQKSLFEPRKLSRTLSLVENQVAGVQDFLAQLQIPSVPVIGITGPPGAGKSTLTDALIAHWVGEGWRVAVICVDPSSPFHFGALLGDRIRMQQWYQNPQVFIRSLASRGALGGLHPHIMEMVDVVKCAGFDRVIIETVGVGQSEVEIAGLADCTVVVMVPEAGDDIQTMKAGLMEIADVFVVNKADRPGAATFEKNLRQMLAPVFQGERAIPIIKTIASQQSGIDALAKAIDAVIALQVVPERKWLLMVEKAWQLIQKGRMKDVSKTALLKALQQQEGPINLYQFISPFLPKQ